MWDKKWSRNDGKERLLLLSMVDKLIEIRWLTLYPLKMVFKLTACKLKLRDLWKNHLYHGVFISKKLYSKQFYKFNKNLHQISTAHDFSLWYDCVPMKFSSNAKFFSAFLFLVRTCSYFIAEIRVQRKYIVNKVTKFASHPLIKLMN